MIIFVTGIVMAGKTTLGRALASRLRCQLIDIDDDIRRLFGPVSTATNTHSGLNAAIGDAGHETLFRVARFWAENRPDESVIITVPMIRPARQKWLSDFCAQYPDLVRIIVVTLGDDTDEEVERRIVDRTATGYIGSVETLAEYRRVKSTAVPLQVPHKKIDTTPPASVDGCAKEAIDYLMECD